MLLYDEELLENNPWADYLPQLKKELADFLEVSQQHLALILGKLNKKECLKVNKKRGQEKLEITFFLGADKIIGELRQAEKEFEKARFADLTEDELREYYRLSAKMKENAIKKKNSEVH